MKKHLTLWLILLLASLSAACAPITRPEQAEAPKLLPLEDDYTLGQTFVARFDGMNGVEIYLAPLESGSGEIQLTLRDEVQGQKLGRAAIPVAEVTAPGFYRFPLPVQADSNRHNYYLTLKIKGAGSIQVGAAPGNTYLNGALYRNGTPDDAHQMAFQLSYHPPRLLLGLAGEFLTWGWYLLVAGWLFVLPGWVMVGRWTMDGGRWTDDGQQTTVGLDTGSEKQEAGSEKPKVPSPRTPLPEGEGLAMRNWAVRLALAAGVGLAVYPILMLWTHLAGLHLGRWYALLPGAAALGWWMVDHRRRTTGSGRGRTDGRRWTVDGSLSSVDGRRWTVDSSLRSTVYGLRSAVRGLWSLPNLVTLLILTLLVFSRFWVIRTLEGPMWGDGMQHTMIVQLLLDHGGLFDSWQPYAPMETFTYHFGFHAAAAAFAWLTGLEARFATLWMGQILNILAVLAVYPLAWKISGGNRWAGTGAVLVAGLLSPMPAFYVNWGRYTQLAGQVILPAAMFVTWDWLDRAGESRLHWKNLALGGILWAGLGLTHYRVLMFGLGFIPVIWLSQIRYSGFQRTVVIIVPPMLIAGLLILPWYIHLITGKLLPTLIAYLQTPSRAIPLSTQQYNAIGKLTDYLSLGIWIGTGFIIFWGFLRRQSGIIIVALWWLLLTIAANPQWLNLPGTGVLTNFAVFIAAYIPASILVGVIIGSVPEINGYIKTFPSLSPIFQHVIKISFGIVLLCGGVWGMWSQIDKVDPKSHALLTTPDVKASIWIRNHMSANARFLVNSFPAYGDNAVVGSDGGWWLPLLAKRENTLPPLPYVSETGPTPDYRIQVNVFHNEIISRGITNSSVLALLEEQNVTHVYIGQQQGRINNHNGNVLIPSDLVSNPHFQSVYHNNRVWIFTFVP